MPRRFLLLLLLSSVWQVSFAAPPPPLPPVSPPTWTLQVDPLTTILGFVHVQVEHALCPRGSLYVGPHLRLYDGPLATRPEPYRGVGLEVGGRWFWRETAPAGGWLGVRGVGAVLRTTDGTTWAPGGYVSALGGYTAILRGRWVLSGGVGGQFLHYRVANLGPVGFFPALHTAVGMAF